MEMVTLDSQFRPARVVENYESLLWTERYSKSGDFELKTQDISETMELLPRESCVSLRNTTVPMMVENHLLEKSITGAPLLTVTGRSYEACAIERRGSVKELNETGARPVWMMPAEKESDAAYKVIRVVIGDTARYKDDVMVLDVINPAVTTKDAIPTVDLILPADYETGETNSYEIKAQNLYNTVIELIEANHRGIKSIRPLNFPGGKIGIEIYNGADVRDTVLFDVRGNQFVDAKYLLSAQGSANVGYVYGSNGAQQVLKTAGPEPEGMERRVLVLDESGDETLSTPEARHSRGLIELYQNNVTALFDGQISDQMAAGYNEKYFMGDILRLVGEYGLSQDVRVAEFIRSSDREGEKAYPTFEAVS